ncbi:hypothetical protein NQK81_02120 [Amycolatopsis roodepoortensis]|nr:hypothetical protein [Amycolatopsis roodepoortensis]UUV32270.1 hypothetical protein NQK81_02120 [Amycolatopsis roodepoortensis]
MEVAVHQADVSGQGGGSPSGVQVTDPICGLGVDRVQVCDTVGDLGVQRLQ